MEEVENAEFDDYELNYPPKLSFEEMNLHLRNTQYHILKARPEFLKTLYYYSKDSKFEKFKKLRYRIKSIPGSSSTTIGR